MGKINYVIGDATQPQGEGEKIICHIVNDANKFGAGFVLAISKKWSYPEQFYRAKQKHVLGDVDVLQVEDGIYVANMTAQHKTYPDAQGNPPIRYDALKIALEKVNKFAVANHCTLHMPRIGCGLAGGRWSEIEAIIYDVASVDVYVYDLN
jgi:O-acetyl-ADP-ribose deacetylase (regulator of RNase III)